MAAKLSTKLDKIVGQLVDFSEAGTELAERFSDGLYKAATVVDKLAVKVAKAEEGGK